MTDAEFIKAMRKLDPFMPPMDKHEIPLEQLYDRFEEVVHEMERLEDLEDDRIELKAHIDYLNEKIAKGGKE